MGRLFGRVDILHLAAVMLENIILGENIPKNIFSIKEYVTGKR